MSPVLDLPQIVLGAALALAVVIGAYAARALTLSGAAAAFILGTLVFGFGGLPWAVLLLTFFTTSSLLSLLFKRRNEAEGLEVEKGSRRDAWQVLANGGIAGLMALVSWRTPGSIFPWLAGTAALAAANADTWATELGALSRKNPWLITTGKIVPRGTSGAVSLIGILASMIGSGLVAAVFGGLVPASKADQLSLAVAVGLGGIAGSLVDSLLGATLQAVYFCPVCQKETEKHPLHHCGTQTSLLRGLGWLNNDWVNFLCTLTGALAALLIFFFI